MNPLDQTNEYPMIAKTLAELEDVLAEELTELGANNVEIGTRMVSFTGNKALMYKANIHCRTALRILKPIHSFKAENADEVYEAVKEVNWDEYLSLDKSFSIDAVVYSHIFSHSKFVAYRVKDAIADWFNERYDKRPNVGLTNPDLTFNIHISHNKCTLSLDSSGESLHKRGYRVAETEAPLNEVLAAGMILKTGWRGETNFVDTMCGSGTLLIEAGMIALGIPPGVHREHFAFEQWADFDQELFSEIYNDDSSGREFKHRIIGSDISPKAISIAEKNVKNAGLSKYIDLSVKGMQQYTEAPKPEGLLMINPPYGERIKVEDLEGLYSMIGERMKHVFTGYNAYVLSFKKECFDQIGLKPAKRFFLFNGQLECEMRAYEIFSGKRKERSRDEEPRARRSNDEEHQRRNSKEGYRRSQRAEEGNRDFGEGSGDRPPRRPFGDSEGRPERKPFENREGRPERKPFERREGSFERKPFGNREDRSERKPFGNREDRPARRPFGDSEGRSERKPFERREGGFERKPFGNREDRPARKPFGDSEGRPERKPFERIEGGFERKPFGNREDRPARKPFGDSEGRPERKPFERREGGFERKPFGNREDRPARKPFGDSEGRPERKPFGNREESKGKRPFIGRGERSESRDNHPRPDSYKKRDDKPGRPPHIHRKG